jgi:epoxyqueuosine reductase QueG
MNRDELLSQAMDLGFDLLGIAPNDEFPTVPPWTRSVVVLGMAALDPFLDVELYAEFEGRKRWSKWAYERLTAGAARLALRLVADGHSAQPLTYENSLALLDLKAAAVRAGLGVRGLNDLVITRRYGPRLHFGAVFTDLLLPADKPLCDYYCVGCSQCITACPTGALGPSGLDRTRCIGEFAPNAAMASLQGQMLEFPTRHTLVQCAECVNACPIGKRRTIRFWGLDPRKFE